MSEIEFPFPGTFRRGARGTIDIVADILKLCSSWKGRTGIMYQGNLSHQMLKFYLWHMVRRGYLEEELEKFRTTDRGREFLFHYQRLASMMAGLGASDASYVRSRN